MASIDLNALDVGAELPSLEFGPLTRATLALYAGASGDHNPVHIDSDFAARAGLGDVFAHGMLSFGVLARAVTTSVGAVRLREFGVRFVAITHVHDLIVCRATVTERFEEAGERRVRLNIVASTQAGRETLSGDAVIAID